MSDTAPPLVATYRWQLTPENGFDAAAAAVPDLAALGVSHLYLSPIAEAVPGSTHGYDVVDPTVVRTEIGGEDGLRRLATTCREHGLGLVIDVVPNHLAAHPANPWWWDVLRLGRHSRWSVVFDVDWDPPKRELRETILLPVLGDHYGRELEAGTLQVERGEGDGRLLVVRYHDKNFPMSPASTAAVLAGAARRAGDDVLGVAARVLRSVEDATVDLDARDADLLVAERTTQARLADTVTSGAALDEELAALNTDVDRLDAVLDNQQHYRLARWRVGPAELDYRRFFDVDSLAATRIERRDVFEAIHALPLRLAADGVVDGLRIDHVDGLPTRRLPRSPAARLPDDAWLVVEKILRPGEELPERWPVDGTTGYEVADLLGAWLTDPHGANELVTTWRGAVGEHREYADVADEGRRLVLTTSLAADVERVTDGLVRVCEGRRRHRDHARAALRDAVIEVAANAPAYRSYVRFEDDDPARPVASPEDEAFVHAPSRAPVARRPTSTPSCSSCCSRCCSAGYEARQRPRWPGASSSSPGPWRRRARRTPPSTAGCRCRTGARSAPSRRSRRSMPPPGTPPRAAAQSTWPRRMTTLSTHDTKRAADVRARLAVLTTVPDEVVAAWSSWWSAAADGVVEPRDAWLVFHTLVGAHPLPRDRAWPVVEKSLREAKLRTSWTAVDDGVRGGRWCARGSGRSRPRAGPAHRGAGGAGARRRSGGGAGAAPGAAPGARGARPVPGRGGLGPLPRRPRQPSPGRPAALVAARPRRRDAGRRATLLRAALGGPAATPPRRVRPARRRRSGRGAGAGVHPRATSPSSSPDPVPAPPSVPTRRSRSPTASGATCSAAPMRRRRSTWPSGRDRWRCWSGTREGRGLGAASRVGGGRTGRRRPLPADEAARRLASRWTRAVARRGVPVQPRLDRTAPRPSQPPPTRRHRRPVGGRRPRPVPVDRHVVARLPPARLRPVRAARRHLHA